MATNIAQIIQEVFGEVALIGIAVVLIVALTWAHSKVIALIRR